MLSSLIPNAFPIHHHRITRSFCDTVGVYDNRQKGENHTVLIIGLIANGRELMSYISLSEEFSEYYNIEM
jgi:hypothetical protein